MHCGKCNAEPIIIRRVLRENLQNSCYCNLDDKPENVNSHCTRKRVINAPFKNVFPKLKQKCLWGTSVRSCLVNLKVIGLHFCQQFHQIWTASKVLLKV